VLLLLLKRMSNKKIIRFIIWHNYVYYVFGKFQKIFQIVARLESGSERLKKVKSGLR
jgi:hypothetical protein